MARRAAAETAKSSSAVAAANAITARMASSSSVGGEVLDDLDDAHALGQARKDGT